MIASSTYQKYLFRVLLCVQLFILVFHLTAGVMGNINPWKLGGYGMYTMPNPRVDITVYINSKTASSVDVNDFKDKNWNFNWYCKTVSKSSLVTLFDQNPDLVGEDVKVIVKTDHFVRYPARLQKAEINRIQVSWEEGSSRFQYHGVACGDREYEGGGEYITR